MNERIRELAREAGLPTYNPEGIPTKLEKFAELLIKECASLVVDDYVILEHFGVEERKDLVCPKCGVDRTLVDELQIECDRLYRIIELNGILK